MKKFESLANAYFSAEIYNVRDETIGNGEFYIHFHHLEIQSFSIIPKDQIPIILTFGEICFLYAKNSLIIHWWCRKANDRILWKASSSFSIGEENTILTNDPGQRKHFPGRHRTASSATNFSTNSTSSEIPGNSSILIWIYILLGYIFKPKTNLPTDTLRLGRQ